MPKKIIGMPELQIVFKHLAETVLTRGEKGQAVLIVKEEKEGLPIITLPTLNSFDEDIQKTFSEGNVTNIKDTLKMQPRELVVVRLNTAAEGTDLLDIEADGKLTTLDQALEFISTKAERNAWISLTDMTAEEAEKIVLFISDSNKFKRKRYKAVVYDNAADNMHIVNFTTKKAKLKGVDELVEGVTLIPMMLGAIAGQSLDSSIIAKTFDDVEYVIEPTDMDAAVDKGELFLYNDDGAIRVGRGVNSLTTIEKDMTHDMKFILIVEVMDLIYSDIHSAWTQTYKGKFKNTLDNQMLFVSFVNNYLEILENESILNDSFDNAAEIDVTRQRLANIPLYGEDEVSKWDDNKVLEMTVGTNVYLGARIKIVNAMEDLYATIIL